MKKCIVIIGCGFAGLWAAIGAARKRHELGQKDLEIQVITNKPYHGIRVRYYEDDLASTRVPLEILLNPIDVNYLIGEVTGIEVESQQVELIIEEKKQHINYDRLVLAAGSQLYGPSLPGLKEYSFNIDTFEAAKKLEKHLSQLPYNHPNEPGANRVVVVGGGFTGLEIATELPLRLEKIFQPFPHLPKPIIMIIDHNEIANSLGKAPQPTIKKTLSELGIESITGVTIESVEKDRIILNSGKTVETQTVIWAAGMRASPLTTLLPIQKDNLGRVFVDDYLRIFSIKHCFAAGDVANAKVDDLHTSVMSCQHARPQGRIAGHNVVADLYQKPLITYRQEAYVTILDLGAGGALYMEGWDRHIVSEGIPAKKTKYEVNHYRIYPPLTGNPVDLFDAAIPIIQAVPDKYQS